MTKGFAACYDIESKIFNLRQGTLSVIEYYDVQVQGQVQEVTEPTLVLEQVQLSEPEISIPENPIEDFPRAWFERFAQIMISLGYKQSQGDHTLFIKHSPDGKLTLLLVYVDDMIIIGDDEIEKLTLKEKLATQFEMKELGKLKYFLEIKVAYSKQGKLIYLSHTRPDIACVVGVVSQFMHDPKERHLQAVERILQYLKASLGKGLSFKKESTLSMEIYTNADYAGSVMDRRFTFRYCMLLGGNLVTWRRKKQNMVVRSSVESKFQAMARDIFEGLWMKIILDYLKVKYEGPIKLLYGNNSAISIAYNPVQHDTTKHIEIDGYFIKEKLNSGLVVTAHVPIGLQVVDVFTKGLPTTRFQEPNGKLGMIDIYLPT
ncbi:Copia protein, partial [Mucuna pruriens]